MGIIEVFLIILAVCFFVVMDLALIIIVILAYKKIKEAFHD